MKLTKFPEIPKKILVIGDAMLDRHIYGEAERLSPEGPFPIVKVKHGRTEVALGAAANVAAHIVSAGKKCILAYKSYYDDEQHSHKQLEKKCGLKMIDLLPLHVRMAHPLTIKERIWANGRQVLRVDIENIEKPNKVLEDEWFDRICSVLNKKQISCVIFSDYDKGTLTDNLIQRITDVCNQDNIPTILDPKRPSFYKLKNLTLIKPNVREINSTNFEPFEVSRKLRQTWLLNTLGKDGMALYRNGSKIEQIPTVAKPNKVVDITGAGDTVSGALGIILASHQDAIKEAMRLSNDLAAISISHRGCYVPTRHQMKKIFGPYI